MREQLRERERTLRDTVSAEARAKERLEQELARAEAEREATVR